MYITFVNHAWNQDGLQKSHHIVAKKGYVLENEAFLCETLEKKKLEAHFA